MKRKANVFLRKEGITRSVNITGPDKPEITQTVVEKWQRIIDLIARIVGVPSGLIMQITEDSMKVFLESSNTENPYEAGESDALGKGLYCETVIGTNAELLIDNASKYDEWKDNPDVELCMISYYGLPLRWPDSEFFGTICVLDSKENAYSRDFTKLVSEFAHSIEKDLELLYKEQELKRAFNEIKVLSGMLPICANCKSIRDDEGYWNQIESYIHQHSEAEFSHSICPECAKKLYPDLNIYEE